MRIRFNPTSVVEIFDLDFVVGSSNGIPSVTLGYTRYLFDEFDYFGKLDVSDCKTIDEAEAKAAAIVDEIFQTGIWDISTDEKRNKYGVTIW